MEMVEAMSPFWFKEGYQTRASLKDIYMILMPVHLQICIDFRMGF